MASNNKSISRTASALKALTYAVPHLAGAIDILVVQQPDGSLKSSPFYVRFGKYTGLRSQDKRVRIAVNDSELDFCMHLGRTGEVYFVTEVEEEVEGEIEAAEAVAMSEAVLDGMASPPLGYSDDEDSGASPRLQHAQEVYSPSRLGTPTAVAVDAELLLREGEGAEEGVGPSREVRRSVSAPAVPGGIRADVGVEDELGMPPPALPATPLTELYEVADESVNMGASTLEEKAAEATGDNLSAEPTELVTAESWLLLEEQSGDAPATVPASGVSFRLGAGVAAGSEHSEDDELQLPGCSVSGSCEGSQPPSQQAEALGRSLPLAMTPCDSQAGDLLVGNGLLNSQQQQQQQQPLQSNSDECLTNEKRGVSSSHDPDHGPNADGMASGAGQDYATRFQVPAFEPGIGGAAVELPEALANNSSSTSRSNKVGPHQDEEGALAPTNNEQGPTVSTLEQPAVGMPVAGSCSKPLESGGVGSSGAPPLVDSHAQTTSSATDGTDNGGETAPKAASPAVREQAASSASAPASEIPQHGEGECRDVSQQAQQAKQETATEALPLRDDGQFEGPTEVDAEKGATIQTMGFGVPAPSRPPFGEDSSSCSAEGERAVPLDSPQSCSGIPSAQDRATSSKQPEPAAEPAAMAGYRGEWGSGGGLSNGSGSTPLLNGKCSLPVPIGNAAASRAPHGGEVHAELAAPLSMSPVSSLDGMVDMGGVMSLGASPLKSSECPKELGESSSVLTPALRFPLQDDLKLREWESDSPSQLPQQTVGEHDSESSSKDSIAVPGTIGAGPLPVSNDQDSLTTSAGVPEGHTLPTLERSHSALTAALHSSTYSSSSALSGKGGKPPPLWSGLEGWVAGGGVQLSMCWHLLRPGMAAHEVAEVFDGHRVSPEQYAGEGAVLLSSPLLACRLGPTVCKWCDALPIVVGLAAFGPGVAAALQDSITEDYPILSSRADLLPPASPSSSTNGAGPTLDRSGASWRGWLFGSWRGSGRKDSLQQAQQQEGATGEEREGEVEGKTVGGNAVKKVERDAGPEEEVPLSQEVALMTAASEGRPTTAAAVEEEEVRVTRGGGRIVKLKRRAFVPTLDQLQALGEQLQEGQNTITFTFGKQQLRAYVYLINWSIRLVISDIDGTITKSDVLGHLGHLLGYDWTHAGITRLFSGIKSNGYDLLFLSSRSIGQASITRDYLHSLEQNGTGMPHGPVIISPDGLFPSLYREVILRRPQEFKIRCLEDIRSLFPPEWNPFYAGFGNRDTDEVSYLAVGVPPSKVFIINPKGELRKASTLMRTSTWSNLDSLGQLLNHMFPALKTHHQQRRHPHRAQRAAQHGQQEVMGSFGKGGGAGGEEGEDLEDGLAAGVSVAVYPTAEREEFNDYNYWRVAAPIEIGSDDEEWGDPEAQGGYESSSDSADDVSGGMRLCG